MRLNENAVDLLEVDDASLVAHRFQERAQTEVSRASNESFARADDQGQGFLSESIVTEASLIELGENELFDDFGRQAWQDD